jgi:LacI family transcriptional regulator
MSLKKTRIKDIARLAGVSIGTVDRVIHKRGEVAEETRLKIHRILKETNYSPNVIAQVLKSKKRYNLVSLLPEGTESNSYWQKHIVGIRKALLELDVFPLTLSEVYFDMQSEVDFQKKTTEVLNLKPNGVLLAPIYKSESITFCKDLALQKIPFVFIDGFIEEIDFLAYIGENIFQSGRVAGHLADIVTPKYGDILVANIARNISNVHHLNKRTNGFLSYFEKPGPHRGKIITLNIPDPSSKTINSELDKAIKKNPGIRTIFVTGSKSYLIAAYLEEKKSLAINLIGYDLLESNVKYMKAGITRFLLGQRPEEQSYKAVKKLFEFLSLNRIPEKIEYLPVDIITSENVDFFL